MRLYLAATYTRPQLFPDDRDLSNMYLLESFYYVKAWQYPLIKRCKSFLIDSGAFTFIRGTAPGASKVDLEKYAGKFADFINETDVDLFFELDIDYVVGLAKVEKMRRDLERRTGKKPIPVWHHSRGREYFTAMCKEYPYVALGGIAIKVWKQEHYPAFHWFIGEAHRHGCEIHGLGFTSRKVREYGFDSVDSMSWLYGGLNGVVFTFDGSNMQQWRKKEKRRKHYLVLDAHNLDEWEKYQVWLDREKA